MGEPAKTQQMTAAAYLVWERGQNAKHEFHRGAVFPMAGGSPRHNYLSSAIAAELRAAVRAKGCFVFSSDQRIAAAESGRYVYADAVVVCGSVQLEPGTTDVLSNPRVIVEVLSPGTETFDRGDKWDAYRRIVSLHDYLLVSQLTAHIEHYQREAGGSWRYHVVEAGGVVTLSDGAAITLDAVYDGAFQVDAG
jgi:Uma2 family endonuclease